MSVIAVDFGGTRCKAGVVGGGGNRGATRVLETPAHGSLARFLPELRDTFAEMADAAAAHGDPVEALVWALPCIIDPAGHTVVRTFGKFDDAPRLDLPGWARAELGLPLLLDNDARAAVFGEWSAGAGRGCDDLVMVTLGTGIGTAVISGGRPLRGATGAGGILGSHCPVRMNGRLCVCGLRGCAEAEVGTWALPQIAGESPEFPRSALAEAAVIDYQTVFHYAAAGDPLATSLRERALAVWAMVLVHLVRQFDPQRIVLGGGIMAAADEILPRLRAHLDDLRETCGYAVDLQTAELGDAAALAGCGWLWKSCRDGNNARTFN